MYEHDLTIRGPIYLIEDTKTYGQKGFRKRLVVLRDESGQYLNYLPMEFVGDRCDMVDSLNVDDEVEIRYRLNGRRWQRDATSDVKFFLSAEVTGCRVLAASQPEQTQKKLTPASDSPSGGDDEVPF